MEVDSSSGFGARDETPLARLDRNLVELVAELRVVQTGVQVLFAFLLVVPFNQGFAKATDFERGTYFATLIATALAAACLIAPSAQHRVLFRFEDKQHLVFVANRLAIAGLVFLSFAMGGAVLLVTTKLFGEGVGWLTLGLIAIPFVWLWFAWPLWRRAALRSGRIHPSAPEEGRGPPPGSGRAL